MAASWRSSGGSIRVLQRAAGVFSLRLSMKVSLVNSVALNLERGKASPSRGLTALAGFRADSVAHQSRWLASGGAAGIFGSRLWLA